MTDRISLRDLRDLLESAPDAIVIAKASGEIVLINSQTEKLFGYSRQELLGSPVERLIPARFAERHQQHRGSFSGDPQPRPMAAGLDVYGLRKGGEEFPVEVTLRPMETPDGILVTAAIRDLTERKRMEVALQSSEQSFQLLVEGVKEYAIFMLDPAGRVASWNSGVERMNGYRPDEIIGRHFSQFYTPEDIAQGRPDHELEAAAAQGQLAAEGWRVRHDGSCFWASVTITATRDKSGGLLGFSKVTRDFTDHKRIEEEIRKLNTELQARLVELAASNRELEAFSYSVSHDLRAPLRQIDGFSRILLDEISEQITAEQRDYLNQVREGTRHMGKLVDSLLDFARLGRQELKRQPVDLHALVGEIIGELEKETSGREIEWRVGPLAAVEGDPALLRQVLLNLLGNALKFTGKLHHAVIEVGEQPAPGPKIPEGVAPNRRVFFVRDNGVGFDMKYADKLFGVFQRLHLQDEFEGTGVGLATVQRIILKHGGGIWAQATPGLGAAFFFTLSPDADAAATGRAD